MSPKTLEGMRDGSPESPQEGMVSPTWGACESRIIMVLGE